MDSQTYAEYGEEIFAYNTEAEAEYDARNIDAERAEYEAEYKAETEDDETPEDYDIIDWYLDVEGLNDNHDEYPYTEEDYNED